MSSKDNSAAGDTAPSWESLEAVLGIAADWIWELDTRFRLIRFAGRDPGSGVAAPAASLLGRTPWEDGARPVEGQSWDRHRQMLENHEPFRRFVICRSLPDGSRSYASLSGSPIFEGGEWKGYRGFGENVTGLQEVHKDRLPFKSIVDSSPDCIFVADAETHRFLYANQVACELTGFSREELLQMAGYQLTGTSKEHESRIYAEAIAAGAAGVSGEVHVASNRDGSRRGWWEPHHRAFRVDGRWNVITVSREISSRILTERELENSKRMYAALSATTGAIMRAKASEELYQGVCDAAVKAGGLVSAAILLADPADGDLRPVAIAGLGRDDLHRAMSSLAPFRSDGPGLTGIALRTGEPCVSNDYLNDPRTRSLCDVANGIELKSAASIPIRRDGETIGILFLCARQRRAFGVEVLKLLEQITENLVFGLETLEHERDREKAEERVRYLATHDSLTGLPNRVLFGELLEQALATARRYQQMLAVMFLDLDRFKLINDTLGHAAGDALLNGMASRLRGVLRESDLIARLGGDEFVILLPNLKRPQDAATVARKLLDAALPPVELSGQDCRVSASIGIGLFPEHGESPQELMRNADTAMYLAKDKGKNTFEFFAPRLQFQSTERMALESALRQAIVDKQFSLHYQAKLDLKTNQITGVEALLRWRHPTLGNISPQRFIPHCEENGSIVPIGRWVLRTACKQNVEWQRQGLPLISMAVNLSARQFSDPQLLDCVREALDESGMDPGLLELELTESMVMLNPSRAINTFNALRNMGVRIALDDFGVGYSSLAQIKGFPIDILKIDRSFIRNLPESSQDRAITEAIIKMARTLSLRVVAEGVETEAQERFLRSLACDESQGFYFSRPAPPEAFSKLFRNYDVTRDHEKTTD